jgi:hypothetical protein
VQTTLSTRPDASEAEPTPKLSEALARVGPPALLAGLLLCFIGLVPILLITYPHIRYLARFWPVFLLLVLGTAERIASLEDAAWRRRALALSTLFMAFGLATLASRAVYNLRHVAAFEHYWFPD